MLLATHPTRAHTILPPQLRIAPVGREIVEGEPTDCFSGAAAWPNIHALFELRSLGVFATQGIQCWLGRGGLMEHDGRLSFLPVSSLGFEVLNELSAAYPGFHWVDGAGASWLVLHPHPAPNDSSRTAFALSWYRQSWLLDPQARHQAIEVLESRLAAVARPGRRWTARERAVYARWAQALRRLQLDDVGMQIMMALSDRAGSVEFAAENVELAAVTAAFDRAPLSADEIWDAIRAATELKIAHLSLAPLGWQPCIIQQTNAVTEAFRVSADSFELQISDLWCEAVAAFADTWRPAA